MSYKMLSIHMAKDRDNGIFVRLTPEQVAGLVGTANNGSDAAQGPALNGTVTVHETRVSEAEARRLRDEGRKEVAEKVQAEITRVLAERALQEKHEGELKAKDQRIAQLERQNRNRERAARRTAQKNAEARKKEAEAKKKAAAEEAKKHKVRRAVNWVLRRG